MVLFLLKRWILPKFREVIDELFGFLPADAGVGDGEPIYAALGLLVAVEEVGLDHQPLDHAVNIAAVAGAVEHLLGDAGLLIPLLAGVGVVRVDDDGGILQTALAVELAQLAQILTEPRRMAWARGLPLLRTSHWERRNVCPCWAALMEFIMTVRSPLVGFFMPTGMSSPLEMRRCC